MADTQSNLDQRINENKEQLIEKISRFMGKPADEVRNLLTNVLPIARQLVEDKKKTVEELLELFAQKDLLDEEQKKQANKGQFY